MFPKNKRNKKNRWTTQNPINNNDKYINYSIHNTIEAKWEPRASAVDVHAQPRWVQLKVNEPSSLTRDSRLACEGSHRHLSAWAWKKYTMSDLEQQQVSHDRLAAFKCVKYCCVEREVASLQGLTLHVARASKDGLTYWWHAGNAHLLLMLLTYY